MKSQCGDAGLSLSGSILDCCLVFNRGEGQEAANVSYKPSGMFGF